MRCRTVAHWKAKQKGEGLIHLLEHWSVASIARVYHKFSSNQIYRLEPLNTFRRRKSVLLMYFSKKRLNLFWIRTPNVLESSDFSHATCLLETRLYLFTRTTPQTGYAWSLFRYESIRREASHLRWRTGKVTGFWDRESRTVEKEGLNRFLWLAVSG